MKCAVFLDRDGVLNSAVVRNGRPFPPATLRETQLLDGVSEAVDLLKERGFGLAVVTNQPDVARGTQGRDVVESINRWIGVQLSLSSFEVCYHDEADDCGCRKPKPGLILRAAEKLGADLKCSFVVGDRWRDVEAGRAAGCRTVWIDHGYAEKKPPVYDFRATSLLEAVFWILAQTTKGTK